MQAITRSVPPQWVQVKRARKSTLEQFFRHHRMRFPQVLENKEIPISKSLRETKLVVLSQQFHNDIGKQFRHIADLFR